MRGVVFTGDSTLELIDFPHPEPGPRAVIRLADRSLHRRLFFSPQMAVGEGYMDGGLVMEEGTTLYDFLDLCMVNLGRAETESIQWMLRWFRNIRAGFRHWNPIGLAQRKVSHHYDRGCPSPC